MKKMTPREALYYICLELGPVPVTLREDNITLTDKERRLRDSIRALQNFIDYHDDSAHSLPDSVEDFVHVEPSNKETPVVRPRRSVRGDGKDRLETWKQEL